ncbi:Nitrilase/cyanide hydratase and apolipoprotein N-acyltransferase [Priestia megaterium WSH-002]|uniref:Nitrilase/cyanide hydratase and apolipoprotein N-acyltransferase n=2 Tax=Bacillaceae TaxID=186817 RepID=A0A8D3X2A5_PRIMW|nr:Nitrilase/cyanide hydratase and apolipoprotein N-acyltransferase [Priestia megaterium WSH-002]MBU8853414.1 hypothetical protein [Bacillus sp. FJAT-26377]QDZ81116.1 hypothetical protein D0440_17275 [Priestia megaterium]
MEIIEGEVKQNENRIVSLFAEKLDIDTEIVVIPEMWNTGYDLKNVAQKADINLKSTFPFIQSLAIKY